MERNYPNIINIIYGKPHHTTHATYHTTYMPPLTPDSVVNNSELCPQDQEKAQVPALTTSTQCSTRIPS